MLDKLERRIGKYAIRNLIYYVLGGYAVGYIFYLIEYSTGFGIYSAMVLEPSLVMHGQIWRLFTWILTVPQNLSFWVIFMFLLYYFIGKSLEATIGSFRYNVYIFSGWFFMTLGSMVIYWISGAIMGWGSAISVEASTYYINLASFLAFAVIYPQYKVYLFGIIPLKVKWLAIFDVVYLGYEVLAYVLMLTQYGALALETMGYSQEYIVYYKAYAVAEIFCIFISILNFIIFWLTNKNIKRYSPKQAARRAQYKRSYNAGQRENARGAYYSQENRRSSADRNQGQRKAYKPPSGSGEIVHRCAICGRTSIDYPNLTFRYCSKCAGNHEYCQDHLFTHEHVK